MKRRQAESRRGLDPTLDALIELQVKLDTSPCSAKPMVDS
jgi:hypothetical protein